MIYSIISKMGGGKTLFTTLYALIYAEKYPKGSIFANYNILGLKNFTYTPFMFLPMSKLKKSLLIIDDIGAIENKSYFTVIVNISRKNSIDVLITAQYDKMIPPKIRTLSKILSVSYYKSIDVLCVFPMDEMVYRSSSEFMKNNRKQQEIYYLKNAVKKAKKHYDTNQIVEINTDSKVKAEIVKYSRTLSDLETNIMLYYKNKSERKKIFDELKEQI